MSNGRLTSIVTPAYNAERFIARCINSVREQTYPHWEQIIVDDGSTDATPAIVAQFDDPRIKYIGLPHRGLTKLAETYNCALANASGELVAILEGDDYWPRDKLARQVGAFTDPDVQLSWGRALTVDDLDRELGWWRQPDDVPAGGRLPLPSLFKILTRKNPLTPAATVMVRRQALDAIGGFRQVANSLFVDLPTWLELSARVSGAAVHVDGCLAYYRVYPQQTSKQRDYEMRYQHHDVVAETIAGLPDEVLLRLSWSMSDNQAAYASASLTRGMASLMTRQRRAAFQHFRAALETSQRGRERIAAVIGLLSAASGVNFLAVAQRVETHVRGEKVHAL